jgi:perosamine synthetase
MFSFGTIKTATALGGALFNFRDAALRAAIAARQRCYPVQPRMAFLRKVMKIALLHALSCRLPYSIFVFMCRALGSNHDRLISSVVRGFPGDELMRKLRLQAPAALLALLDRRLRRCAPSMLEKRIASSMHALQRLPAQFHLGARAEQHSHWVFPIQSDHPDRLVCRLWQHGFDATRGASSLYAVPAPDGRAAAVNAQRMMDRVVYLPVESCASEVELQRMVQAVTQFAARPDSG